MQHLINSGFAEDYIDVTLQSADEDTEFSKNQGKASISSFFSSLFGNEEQAEEYFDYALSGSIVTVHTLTTQDAEQAADILDEYGAVNLEERARAKLQARKYDGASVANASVSEASAQANGSMSDSNNANTGGMRVCSRIIEQRVEEKMRLRDERVQVANTTASNNELLDMDQTGVK